MDDLRRTMDIAVSTTTMGLFFVSLIFVLTCLNVVLICFFMFFFCSFFFLSVHMILDSDK
ncbi:hypothetical protein GLOIN_2v1496838 [Rhizophagus irregularis DAOM 181602=DAOM 197198]|uniref:Uncharacterized protein n=1 Tax=Rhizophagus irregularis (strain DAOM 181602 / DAOM 197198 / MUCL 43194) TaxID=747089 RepID=A0A2P4QYA0_RHIID|nr:hypothetical protein GLOIN_2v1496838 [Rhizophagus irregularis DAOM 181602=DAOM 197198]POG82630.1 hypothetical protein GLOIN_2v1496838 [Rhizophagus irregularis DAOM 181602=DAOM 197198]|eukprot:XP_025189496.1 hypothetical protein GLOIN_2v1496838 [Rhizophagus irregularis DAOM 181602=DAOM 197198]